MSAELIAKLESASEGSRELDAEIDAWLFGGRASHTFDRDEVGGVRASYDKGTVFKSADPTINGGVVLTSMHRCSQPVTTSIDAALALAERVLPEFDVSVGTHWCAVLDIRGPHATVSRRVDDLGNYEAATAGTASAATPALAICAALLRASAAEGAG